MKKFRNENTNIRFYLIIVFVFILFFAVIARITTIALADKFAGSTKWQGIKNIAKVSSKVKEQEAVEFERGLILDRTGEKLAFSVKTVSLSMNPKLLSDTDKHNVSSILIKNLNLSDSEIKSLKKNIRSEKSFIWIKRRMPLEQYETVQPKIKKLFNKGISKSYEFKRIYPDGPVFANIIGYAGIDNSGLEGIELAFDKYLKSSKNNQVYKTATGVYLNDGKIIDSLNMLDVVLTIDKNIQSLVYEELKNVVDKFEAKRAMCLMIQPKTGDVLAMVQYPDYDNNYYQNYKERRNWIIADMYEPGSTMKTVTVSALIEEGITPLDKKVLDPSYVKIYTKVYHNSHSSPPEWLTLKDAFVKSSNVGIIKFTIDLPNKVFYSYLRDFGFGIQTGIELPGEAKGSLRKLNEWQGLTKYSTAIGQEIAVTPIQLVMALSTIANNGILLQPHIIKEIRDCNGNIILQKKPTAIRQVVTEKTVNIVKSFMEDVVNTGTGKKAFIQDLKLGGKTGTAQKAGIGGYQSGKYISSFFGFLPIDNPEISMLVLIDEPSSEKYSYLGGDVAAPVFKSIAIKTLEYLKKYEYKDIVEEIDVNKPNFKISKIINSELNSKNLIDLKGYSVREALKYLSERNIIPEVKGTGYVQKQVPEPGISFDKVKKVTLYLSVN